MASSSTVTGLSSVKAGLRVAGKPVIDAALADDTKGAKDPPTTDALASPAPAIPIARNKLRRFR